MTVSRTTVHQTLQSKIATKISEHLITCKEILYLLIVVYIPCIEEKIWSKDNIQK
jgi:hypothetical protein